jgi:hypothetical protein
VTKREKELLARIYGDVQRLATVGPRNPADIRALARADKFVAQQAPVVASAISNLGFGDFEQCVEDLDRFDVANRGLREGDSQ